MDESLLQAELLHEFNITNNEQSIEDQCVDDQNDVDDVRIECEQRKISNTYGKQLILLTALFVQGLRSSSNLIYIPSTCNLYTENGENKTTGRVVVKVYHQLHGII